MTAGDLAERFDMTKPSMSHHFAVLKEADLITSRRDGQQIWYGLNTTVVQDLMAWAMDLIRSDERKIDERKIGGDEKKPQAEPQEKAPPNGDIRDGDTK